MKWIKTFENFETDTVNKDLSKPSDNLFGEIQLGSQAAEEYLQENPEEIENLKLAIKTETEEIQQRLIKFIKDFDGKPVEIAKIEKSEDVETIIKSLLSQFECRQKLEPILISGVKTINSIFSGKGFLFSIGVAVGLLSIAISTMTTEISIENYPIG